MANVCPTGLFFETQAIEEGLFEKPSCLQTHKHPSVCLQRKGGPALDLHANEEPQEETSLPFKGLSSPASFVPAPACQHSLAAHTPDSPIQGPRSSLRSIPSLCPVPL